MQTPICPLCERPIPVGAGAAREIGFVAENPGDRMFHCHMPVHQMSGMMIRLRQT